MSVSAMETGAVTRSLAPLVIQLAVNVSTDEPDLDVISDTIWTNGSAWNATDAVNGSISNDTYWNGDNNIIFISLTSAVLGVLILATIVGNVFVIAAILLERHLHSVANYLIVSLAVADLLVACLVMPLSAVYEISKKWILGPELCDMWTSSDVLCCTASILHLVAIAVDRYWAVTNVDYIHNRNGKRIGTMIFLVWAVALALALAPLFGWKDAKFLDRVNIEQRCMISQDVAYQIFATCATFYVPLAVILIVYWKIFQTARRRIRKNRRNQAAAAAAAVDGHHGQQDAAVPAGGLAAKASRAQKWFRLGRNNKSPTLIDKPTIGQVDDGSVATPLDVKASSSGSPASLRAENDKQQAVQTTAFTIEVPTPELHTSQSMHNGSSLALTSNEGPATTLPAPATPSVIKTPLRTASGEPGRKKRETLEAKREKKAAKTLAIITGAFVVCWLPFFVCALLMPLCPSCVFDDAMLSVFLWLGYLNSTLNPIIYTIFSPEFRQAFKRLLCGKSAVQTSAYRPRKLR